MSNQDRVPVGSDNGSDSGNTRRVGDSEREAAVAQLMEHWHAGRLDPAEHELRVTRAKAAVTQADLNGLFNDLPSSEIAPESSPQMRTGAGAPARQGDARDNKRETIMALVPFVALVLFFTTHSWFAQAWLWFLMIPVAGTLLFGANGRPSGRHGWFWRRN